MPARRDPLRGEKAQLLRDLQSVLSVGCFAAGVTHHAAGYRCDMTVFDESNLPEDPRDNGFVDAHGPDGRIARVREASGPFVLIDPETKKKYEMDSDGFLVWEDGEWRAISRDEFLDGPWDVDLGDAPSAIEAVPDE